MKKVLKNLSPLPILLIAFSLLAKPVTNDQKKLYIDEQIRFADGLVEREHYDLAIDEYQRLIKKFPKDELVAEAWIQLAEAYAAKKDFAKSFKTFEMFFEHFPNIKITPAATLRYALTLYASGETPNKQKAVRLLNRLKTDPKIPLIIQEAATFHLGKIFLQNKDLPKAEQEFTVLAKKQVSDKSHNFRAYAAIELADLKPAKEAINILKPIAETTTLPPEILKSAAWKLGDMLYEDQQFSEAAAVFAKIAVLYPTSLTGQEARYRRLECLYRMKDYTQIVAEANKMIKAKKLLKIRSSERLVYLKALALKKLKFYPQAIEILQKLLDEKNNSKFRPLAAYSYIECLLKENKEQDAAQNVLVYTIRNDIPPEALKDVVLLFVNSTNNNPKYISIIDSALKTMPAESKAASSLQLKKATLLLAGNKNKAAIQIYQKVVEKGFPAMRPYALMGLAQTYSSKKRDNEAIRAYQKLLKTYPKTPIYPDALLRTAVLLLQDKKQWETAEAYLKTLTSRFPNSEAADSAVFYQAYMLFEKKKYVEAEKILDKLADKKNISEKLRVDAMTFIIWIYLKMERMDEAMLALKKQGDTIFSRGSSLFLIELGDALLTTNPKIAEKAYKTATSKGDNMQQQKAYTGLANAQLNSGDPVKAIESLKTAVKLNADPVLTATAQNKLGNLLFARGKKEEAVMIFEKCLENPVNKKASAQARLGLAKILSQDKASQKRANRYAMSVFILSQDPEICSEAMLLSIKISIETGNKKEAESTWKEFSGKYTKLAKEPKAQKLKSTLDKMP